MIHVLPRIIKERHQEQPFFFSLSSSPLRPRARPSLTLFLSLPPFTHSLYHPPNRLLCSTRSAIMINLAAVVSFLAVSVVVLRAQAFPSLGDSRHHHRDVAAQFQERGYAKDDNLLEPYENYHRRYELFHCQSRHDTAFWNRQYPSCFSRYHTPD